MARRNPSGKSHHHHHHFHHLPKRSGRGCYNAGRDTTSHGPRQPVGRPPADQARGSATGTRATPAPPRSARGRRRHAAGVTAVTARVAEAAPMATGAACVAAGTPWQTTSTQAAAATAAHRATRSARRPTQKRTDAPVCIDAIRRCWPCVATTGRGARRPPLLNFELQLEADVRQVLARRLLRARIGREVPQRGVGDVGLDARRT